MAKKAIAIYLKKAVDSGFSFIKRKFKSVKELNKNFQAQRAFIYQVLEKKADYKRRLSRVLEVLKMHSCKYLGISYLTENRICEAYEAQFGESISKRTVSTCIKHLVELAFVKTIATKREDGKQSANIIVIEKMGEQAAVGEKHQSDEEEKEADSQEPPGAEVAHKDAENLHTKKNHTF